MPIKNITLHPTPPPPSLSRPFTFHSLGDEQTSLLHAASLEILARTGARFYDQDALDLFKRGGAQVSDGNLVRIPAHLVEWALRAAPKDIAIYNRTGERAMWLGGYRCYYGVGSDCLFIYDLATGQRRQAVLNDVVDGVRLVDALPHLDFVMSMFVPSDAPVETYEAYQMDIMLRESTKPVVFVGMTLNSTIHSIEMASAIAGGLEALERKPFVVNYVNPSNAFHHNQEAVQRLLYAAERNLPTIYMPPSGRGTSAPMTTAGAMAVGNAGQLAGLVLAQLKREGSPYIRTGAGGGGLDMRTMVSSYGAPDGGPFGWDMAHHYGLPIFGTAGCSDAKVFDAQAAAEAAISLLTNTLGGANLIHDIGYLDFAMTGSLELVAFCDEIIGWIKCYLRPLEITDETLALDLIQDLGPDGSFLDTPHTVRHCRENWMPTLMDRQNYERWAESGSATLQERANRKVRQILGTHRAEPLPEDVQQTLKAVVERADREAHK
jgi:trimethylamine--corrinoid protein Co-methyltransferase